MQYINWRIRNRQDSTVLLIIKYGGNKLHFTSLTLGGSICNLQFTGPKWDTVSEFIDPGEGK